ncbi:MAG: hypothetical protein HY810_02300 [Candidatus Omnitrophica bacterium]|nr:hypothetical protein [Candidatus Omnitrophota bacterium]
MMLQSLNEKLSKYDVPLFFLLAAILIVSNYQSKTMFGVVLLGGFYLIAMPRLIYLYLKDNKNSFKKVIYIYFIMIFVHVHLTTQRADRADKTEGAGNEPKKVYKVSLSSEDNIPFLEKPYFYSGIKVRTTEFSEGRKVVDCSLDEKKLYFQCTKKYSNIENSDFSFLVTYYPEMISGTSKFTIVFQFTDEMERELGFLTYVLYGASDFYFHVNNKVEDKVFATYIVDPIEGEWKTFEAKSIIDDYNARAKQLEGKLWAELKVKKMKLTIMSWNADGEIMNVYLKGLQLQERKKEQ